MVKFKENKRSSNSLQRQRKLLKFPSTCYILGCIVHSSYLNSCTRNLPWKAKRSQHTAFFLLLETRPGFGQWTDVVWRTSFCVSNILTWPLCVWRSRTAFTGKGIFLCLCGTYFSIHWRHSKPSHVLFSCCAVGLKEHRFWPKNQTRHRGRKKEDISRKYIDPRKIYESL